MYKPEPVWRSPFTLAVLTWMSWAIGILGLLPLQKMVRYIRTIFSGSLESLDANGMQISLQIFAALFMLLIITLAVRRIAKLQARHQRLASTEARIKRIALDINNHFVEGYKDTGFKAMLATNRKRDAVSYLACLNSLGI